MNNFNSTTVFIPVKGGLGNQMFFYAFSLYLNANSRKSILVWHEYIFTKQHNGVDIFNAFDIDIDNNSKRQICFFLKINKSFLPYLFKRIIGRIFRCKYLFVRNIRQTSPYSFDNLLPKIERVNIYMDGFWQNYQYLNSIREKVLESFRFRLPKDFYQNIYLKKIISCTSVSIHIRRGDYLDVTFADLNVIKSTEYYFQAIKYFEKKIENPIFFIFTDDMLWAKLNFKGNKFIFVEGNENMESYLDMYLMSKCNHNIIANSTFSWWGAWLNIFPSKIVISPKQWTQHVLSSQLCPPDWIFI